MDRQRDPSTHPELDRLRSAFDRARVDFDELRAAFDQLEGAHLARRTDDAEVEVLRARVVAFHEAMERVQQLTDEFREKRLRR